MFTAPRNTPLDSHPDVVPLRPGLRPQAERRALCVMPATVEAVPLLRRFTRETARRWELGDESDEALGVIVTELVANVVRHSGSLDVAVLLMTNGHTVTLQVQDTGKWRARRPRLAGDDAAACCGRGLRMVRAYALDCVIVRTGRGTRVAVTLTTETEQPGPVQGSEPGMIGETPA